MNNKTSIIIVDDNEIDLMIAERLLSRVDSSIELTKFGNSTEILDWLDGCDQKSLASTTIFLVDIYMPLFNGYYVAEQIAKVFAPLENKAVIYLLSATIEILDNRKLTLNPQVSGYIGKPVTVELFKDLIEKYS